MNCSFYLQIWAKNSIVTYTRLSKFKWQSQDSNPDFFWESITFSIEKSLRKKKKEKSLREYVLQDGFNLISFLRKASK